MATIHRGKQTGVEISLIRGELPPDSPLAG